MKLKISKLVKFLIKKARFSAKENIYIAKYYANRGSRFTKIKVGDERRFLLENYDNNPTIKVVSPAGIHCMTTFFDVDPLSPCGKFLVATCVPFINRIPFLGDKALICVISLVDGTYKIVADTRGWGAQLGANVQWGKDSATIFFNDVKEKQPVGIKLDLRTLNRECLEGTIYSLDSQKLYSYSANLKYINAFIPGYGIPERPFKKYRRRGIAKNDGIWKSNLKENSTELYLSIDEIITSLDRYKPRDNADYYIFHVKINANSTKIFFVLFCINRGLVNTTKRQLIVCDLVSKALNIVVTEEEWDRGGHHPNWMPDNETILMNLKDENGVMRFYEINSTNGVKKIVVENVVGGGHPSVDVNNSKILTDAYVSEGMGDSDGKVPIRLVDKLNCQETHLARINTGNVNGPCRIDPHPFWNNEFNMIIWNGIYKGNRSVFIADMSNELR